MIRSAAEIRAEVMKAARGAGLPLGVAEDLAVLSHRLNADGLHALGLALRDADQHATLQEICLARDLDPDAPLPFALRAVGASGAQDIPEVTWHTFTDLATRVYVPESAASRAAGAGAGDIDND